MTQATHMPHQPVLDVSHVSHGYQQPSGYKGVLHDVHCSILRGQIVAMVGPSGCGKSTLLRAIVGTHPPSQGEIVVLSPNGARAPVRGPGRDRGIVYQNYALFDFLTVLENAAFGLMLDETSVSFRLLRYPAWRKLHKQHLEKAAALLTKVGLAEAMHRYPSELSGGMRQRVAIAQALVMEPAVLLLDEPFGALDEATREELQRMLLRLYADNLAQLRKGLQDGLCTIIIVTHELTEAIFVSDRILGLSQYWDWRSAGHTVCPGATLVYDQPAPIFSPDDVKQPELFAAQREEIAAAVFDPNANRARTEFKREWSAAQADASTP
jgi:NitT/TauT family transport system ATP-binding protein